MADLITRTRKRFQIGVRLADGTYTAPTRWARTAADARRDVIRTLNAEGHKGFRIERVRCIPA
jgi:hypothetical protein